MVIGNIRNASRKTFESYSVFKVVFKVLEMDWKLFEPEGNLIIENL